jgi:hypothetical protein
LRVVAKAVDFVIPRPCCRQTACCDSWDPCGGGCDSCSSSAAMEHHHYSPGPVRQSDPFVDDGPEMAPTPMPAREARSSVKRVGPVAQSAPVAPREVLTTRPLPAAQPRLVASKPAPRLVAKVSHEEEASSDDNLAAPAAPRSVRSAPQRLDEAAPLPQLRSAVKRSSNPLR